MIPVTYDGVRIEQENRLARLELRRHARAAERTRHRQHIERVRPLATHSRRLAVAVGALLVAVLALIVF
jgi:hypothetical protein